MMMRIGIPLLYIGRADQACIADAGRWGTYYEQNPCVFASPYPEIFHRVVGQEGEQEDGASPAIGSGIDGFGNPA